MLGEWIRKPKGEASVVFVHGILSSGEAGWTHESGAYWPELVKNEEALAAIGIYVYTYQTELFGGNYRLGDVVDDLKERMKLDGLLNCKYIIFVCHSMGGIVVRQFLLDRQSNLIDKNIQVGLFLIGSPSLGSSYANWLAPIAWMAKNAQALALRFSQNNAWLNDLAKNFRNLKEEGKLRIIGKELIEDKPIKLPIVFRIFLRRQIVEPFSAATYFADSYKVPGSDHFSIAKPTSKDAIQHRLLRDFIIAKVMHKREDQPIEKKLADVVCRKLTLACHAWKNSYMDLQRKTLLTTPNNFGDVWDWLIGAGDHEDSAEEWNSYRPLFDEGIKTAIDTLNTIVACYGDAIPSELKIKVISTTGRLSVEQEAFALGPAVSTLKSRAEGVLRALAELDRAANARIKESSVN